jgi:hypothetical protein
MARRGLLRPLPCTRLVRISTISGSERMPRHRSPAVAASATGAADHPEIGSATVSVGPNRATLSGLMAKAKRRKLRARRNKANHGRRPNAGRG